MTMFARPTSKPSEDEAWISVSDLMAGLMVVFLFIAVVNMTTVQERENRVREVAVAFDQAETRIVEALADEFAEDLERWDAELDQDDLLIRFRAPEVLFEQGKAELRPQFEEILRDFFPRYVGVLEKFQESVEEIRIEGHTSSDWAGVTEEEAFFQNMALSQARTRAVLSHSLDTIEQEARREWLRGVLTANGLSSSKLVMHEGIEDPERSRRVEFKVRTDAKRQIVRILETFE